MKFKLLLVFLLAVFLKAESQNLHCGTDEMHIKLLNKNPTLENAINRNNSILDSLHQNYTSNRGATYIIPVVFHVVHNYGPENISDAQIIDAVRLVNEQMRKKNADTTDIQAPFKNSAADVDIEIRLAQKDPNGDCTNGITRNASPLTLPGDHSVKSIVHWPPDQYLNIYVCKDAAGLAGHSLLPAAADTIPSWDGIVMKHDYIGSIGTSSNFRRTVLTHEIGHFLNLQHIWGGNNVPNYYYLPVGDAGNCSFDDGVSDTPLTIGWSSCTSNPQSCSSLDNIHNYMDYAYCARMFTEGQKTRMHAALNSSIANRDNLWQPANLAATGTDGNDILCKAKIGANKTVICAGESISFYDLSYNGVTDRLWNFPGGNISSSPDSSVSVTYNAPGIYQVSLEASNGTDTVSTTKTNFIEVLPNQNLGTYLIESFENTQLFEANWVEEHGDNVNAGVAQTGFSSDQSYKFDNFNANKDQKTSVYSYPIDVSNYSALSIRYDYAFSKVNSNNLDQFLVSISTDCGQTWIVRESLYANSGLTTISDTMTGIFTPQGDTDWSSSTINIPSVFLNSTLMVKFALTNDGGNNLYLDNVNIAHPDELKISYNSTLSTKIYPNPTQDHVNVKSEAKINAVVIYNEMGQVVFQKSGLGQKSAVLSLNLTTGYYIAGIKTEKGKVRKPLIVHP